MARWYYQEECNPDIDSKCLKMGKWGKWTVKYGALTLYRIVPDRVHEPVPDLVRGERDIGNI